MNRPALAAALLALLTGAPVDAAPGSKAIFTCGTDLEPARRTEGRVDTGGLSALSFKPDFRGIKPLLIPYKSITRLEFGPAPGRGAEAAITPPCALNGRVRYLTIFYRMELSPEEQEWRDRRTKEEKKEDQKKKDNPDSRETREKERKELQERTDRKYEMDRKEKEYWERKDRAKEIERDLEKEHIAVFVLDEGLLRPTFRIVETRSGKRVIYQDAAARKAAR